MNEFKVSREDASLSDVRLWNILKLVKSLVLELLGRFVGWLDSDSDSNFFC